MSDYGDSDHEEQEDQSMFGSDEEGGFDEEEGGFDYGSDDGGGMGSPVAKGTKVGGVWEGLLDGAVAV